MYTFRRRNAKLVTLCSAINFFPAALRNVHRFSRLPLGMPRDYTQQFYFIFLFFSFFNYIYPGSSFVPVVSLYKVVGNGRASMQRPIVRYLVERISYLDRS